MGEKVYYVELMGEQRTEFSDKLISTSYKIYPMTKEDAQKVQDIDKAIHVFSNLKQSGAVNERFADQTLKELRKIRNDLIIEFGKYPDIGFPVSAKGQPVKDGALLSLEDMKKQLPNYTLALHNRETRARKNIDTF